MRVITPSECSTSKTMLISWLREHEHLSLFTISEFLLNAGFTLTDINKAFRNYVDYKDDLQAHFKRISKNSIFSHY